VAYHGESAFVFLDPPYIVRTETYQRGMWGDQDERDLWAYVQHMEEAGILFAWTTYLHKDGATHPLADEIEALCEVTPIARKMDARPGGTGTGETEAVITSKPLEVR